MVLKTVEVCDICQKELAVGKCFVCGRSVCRKHSKKLTSLITDDAEFSMHFEKHFSDEEINGKVICEECYERLKNALRKMEFKELKKLGEKMEEEALKVLLKEISLKALE